MASVEKSRAHIGVEPCVASCMTVALLLLLAISGVAQDTTKVAEKTSKTRTNSPQDVIDALRKNREPYYVIRSKVLVLYQDKDMRPRLLALFKEEKLAANVLTALAMVFSEEDEREPIPLLLRALVAGRLRELEETIVRYSLPKYHERKSILPEVSKILNEIGKLNDNAAQLGFTRLVNLIPNLVEAQHFKKNRLEDSDRYAAIELILQVWKDAPIAQREGAAALALRTTLSSLVAEAVTFETAEDGEDWFAPYRRESERDKHLSLAQVYADIVVRLRTQNAKLRESRRADVTALIQRLRAAGEPPTRFLLDPDKTLRMLALRAIESMSDTLGEAPRSQATKDLIASLKRTDLSEELYRVLLQASGALGHKSTQEEKTALVSAVFDGRMTGSAPTLRAKLDAAGRIGFLDKPARLTDIYVEANRPERSETETWRVVRQDVIKLAQELGQGLDLIVTALQDGDSRVRGIAAVSIASAEASWTEETVDALIDAISGEKDEVALGRMLGAVESVVKQKPATFSARSMAKLLELEFPAIELKSTSRLATVLMALSTNPSRFRKEESNALQLIKSAINAENRELRAKLVAVVIAHPSPLGLPLLIAWLGEAENAKSTQWRKIRDFVLKELDEKKAWTQNAAALWQVCLGISAVSVEEAALTAQHALASIEKLPAMPEGIKVKEIRTTFETWSLESKSPVLWRVVLDRQNQLVEKAPKDLLHRARRADIAEKLAMVWTERRKDLLELSHDDLILLTTAKKDAPPPNPKAFLDLARIEFLQNKLSAARKSMTKGGEALVKSEAGVWLGAAIVVFDTPGEVALKHLRGVSEELKKRSPQTASWLQLVAGALSRDVADWPTDSTILPQDSSQLVKDIITQRIALHAQLESVLRARLEGKVSPKEEKITAENRSELVFLVANRSLAALKTDPPLAQKMSVLLVEWTKNGNLGWPAKESPESLAVLAKELGKMKADPTFNEKLHHVFLKTVGAHLYSLD